MDYMISSVIHCVMLVGGGGNSSDLPALSSLWSGLSTNPGMETWCVCESSLRYDVCCVCECYKGA